MSATYTVRHAATEIGQDEGRPRVRLAERRLWIGDRSYALLSGEVHYWRLDPLRWHEALARARELGLALVASYVCWDHHELVPGRWDFRGDTARSRNLVGFLEAVAREGVLILLRPGPYIYSEWRNSGVPDRAVRYHRLHPEFLAAAEQYMAAAVDAFGPYLATRGGPIAMVQADNEPDLWGQFYGAQLGLGREPGPFQRFLADRYGTIDALNETWETRLRDFTEARAVTRPEIRERGYVNRYLDYCRFRHNYATEIVRWATDTYRRLGVDVPIYANAYSGLEVQDWRGLEGRSDLAGPDVYPGAEFRGDGVEHRRMLDAARRTRTYSVVPYIPEFGSGIWHGWHYRRGIYAANHYVLAGLSALLAGVVGWNWYMLVERDNWYMTPITAVGRARPELAPAFASIVRVFREIDPPSLEKLTETAVTMDPLSLASKLEQDESVLQALYDADIDHEAFDVEYGQVAKPVLLYGGGSSMSAAAQRRLARYVEGGGHLVFFQRLPISDESLRSCNLLDLRLPDGILRAPRPHRLSVRLGDRAVALSAPSFFSYERVPGEPIEAERLPDEPADQEGHHLHAGIAVGDRYVIGYRQRRGDGSLTVLGVAPDRELLAAIHAWLGYPVYCRVGGDPMRTAIFRRDHGFVLIAVNNGEEDHLAEATLDPRLFEDRVYTVRDLMRGEERRQNLFRETALRITLPRKSGTVLQIG